MNTNENKVWGPSIRESERRELAREITGVIQNDRIWEQWYDQSVLDTKLPKMSQKDYLFSCIGEEPNREIIDYRGVRRITVEEFRQMILKFEKAFASRDYKVGDVVCTIALTTPELYAIKYAATSLGLITCNLNVLDIAKSDNGKCRLLTQMENVSPRFIFIVDALESKVYKVVNDPVFDGAIKVRLPLDYSFPNWNAEKLALKVKSGLNSITGKKVNEIFNLDEFLKFGKDVAVEDLKEVYEEGMPCNISFTSGTTGINKAVLLSHDANNALAYQHKIGGFDWQKGDRQLALVPPFLAFWDADIVHNVLCLGGVNVIELYLEYDKIPEYFVKHDNIKIGAWSQYLWSSLMTLSEDNLEKIRKTLTWPIVGGERCDYNEQRSFFEKTGILQKAGFGASEVNTAFSITHPNVLKPGSCGIPLPFNNVKILGEDGNNTTYGKPGRLFITGPCLMNGYYNRPDLTEKVIITDENGVRWYSTGDYAVLDSDGCLTVLDRYIPPISIRTENGFENVNMLDITEMIKTERHIKYCRMTEEDGLLIFHVVLRLENDESSEHAEECIINHILENVPKKYQPDFIDIAKAFPRTSVGKLDHRALRDIGIEICKKNVASKKLTIVHT